MSFIFLHFTGTVYGGIYARVSNHIIVTPQEYQKCIYVDTAGIGRKKMLLSRKKIGTGSGEVSIITSWYSREVSRGHSTHRKRGAENCIGLTIGEGLNAILPKIRMGALICSPFIKYGIVSIGVKSDWKDGLRTAVYETRWVYPERSRRVRWCERRTVGLLLTAVYSIGSNFLFKCSFYVVRQKLI